MGQTTEDSTCLDALIVGAGFTGLYQLHCLRDQLGLSAKVLERAPDVGGTWYWNRYPGARCDSESHSYCYTFSEALYKEWRWKERYPSQPEVLAYLNHVADRFDLRKDIQVDTTVTKARFDEQTATWTVETERGETGPGETGTGETGTGETGTGEVHHCRFLILATGCLSSTNVPNIPGLEDFQGAWYHTGQWPHEGVDFTGLRVGQIGTGSTGIQTAPLIAKEAAHLTVFQRTANYSIPARNKPLSERFQDYAHANYPDIRRVMRMSPNGHPFLISERSALDADETERQQVYQAGWATGGFRFRASFRDIVANEEANKTAAAFVQDKIRQQVEDADTAEALADIDHPFAAKRPPIDTDYFQTFNRDNVRLVNLRTTPIERITSSGVKTSDAEFPLDALVFATGFDAMTGSMLKIQIEGRGGLALQDVWREGPVNYLGLQVPGFPNMFTMTGPGSPSVLCNMPVPIEQHVEWVAECLRAMRDGGKTTIEADPIAAEEWQVEVNRAANATVLSKAPHSWYYGANIPGKPQVFMPYAGGMHRYRERCDAVAQNGYEGFRLL